MLKVFRRSSGPVAESRPVVFSAPPAANPVEVGLGLRTARERMGISLEQARESTGVPRVDLEALERGRLELLHVEQAAIVGLWRYAELLGLDPAPLVAVVRSHWPRPALAVDALYSESGGAGMPCARLALGEGILSKIVPKARELTWGSVRLGISEATRLQLAKGAAHAVLTVAVIGPAPGAASSRARPTTGAISTIGASTPAGEASPSGRALAGPPEPSTTPTTTSEPGPAGEPVSPSDPVDAGEHGSDAQQRGRRWPGQLAHVVAERFGLDPEDDGDAVTEEGPSGGSDGALRP